MNEVYEILRNYDLNVKDIDNNTLSILKEVVSMELHPIAMSFLHTPSSVSDEEAAEFENAIIVNCPTLVSFSPEYREWLHETINHKVNGKRVGGSNGFYYAFFDYCGILSQYL